ncbi:TonB-dependent receptor [Aestuariibacter halophilus]|uniref:TonB-dependent receptor n=1 Tax=Fluctibacter halophilus TaxID=226011 RepID=A0ABS8G9K3_9ALTE|nr:TonB-dependent receptor [Aestuariibacter halophilus]MCC2616404.1 TonB-dependent receptor [Aestuariibacter halophilus]
MTSKFFTLAASLIAIHTTTSATAQSQPSDSQGTDAVETIVITGARSPINQQDLAASVSIIDQQLISASQATDMADLLRGVAGLSFSQSGGPGALNELRMRGNESNHVVVMIDGVPVNDAGQADIVDFAHINLSQVQRVEILKGPQSALWGSGAVGGVINIVTQAGLPSEGPSTVRLEAGESNSQRLEGSYQQRFEDSAISLSAFYRQTDGQNIALTGNEKDGYRLFGLSAGGQWLLSPNWTLNSQWHYSTGRNEFDNYVPADADNSNHLEKLTGRLVLRQNHTADWYSQWGVSINDQRNRAYASTAFSNTTDSRATRWFAQTTAQFAEGSRLTGAVEHLAQDFEQQAPASFFGDPNQQQRQHTNSVLIDGLWRFAPQWSTTLSARHDSNSVFDNGNSYRLGVSWQIMPRLRIYVSQSRAIKNPTFTELFGYTPANFIGNPDLQPERADSTEIGLNWDISQHLSAQMSLYDTKLEDEIQTVYSSDYTTSSAINQSDNSRRKGIELALSGEWADVFWSAEFAYTDAEQPLGMDGWQVEPRRAKRTAALSVTVPLWDDKGTWYTRLSYQGPQQDTDFNTFSEVTLGGYGLLNTTLSYDQTAQLQWYVKATNLLDKDYQDVAGYQGQHRNISVGGRYRF